MENKYLKDVYRSRGTIVEQLTNRGYDMTDTISELSFNAFSQLTNFNMVDKNNKIYVHYASNNIKLNVEIINEIVLNILKEYNENIKVLIIYTNIINNVLNKKFNNVQLFNLNEVIIDKTKHVYANQKHTIIGEEELNTLLDKYKKTKDQLPKILHKDPMVKIIGANIGDVIKIQRKSKSTGIYYFYRVCV